MLYVGPFKMVPYNFLLMQQSNFIYSAIWNESQGDTSLLDSHDTPVNKATGHPQWQNVNKQKINGVTKPGHWLWYNVVFMLQMLQN